jgi:SAM-dependent methyltransferase
MEREPARVTYDAFAPIYNEFNHQNDYEMWLGEVLLPELEKHGLKRGRALDVGCGTGRAFGPLLRRGWEVRACDLSPGMLERAREEGGDRVRLDVVDMRELPVYGEFELVLSLNDAVNYLLGDDDLTHALGSMARALAPDGLLIFDTNTLRTYRSDYTGAQVVETEDVFVCWRGEGVDEGPDGDRRACATIEIFRRAYDGSWERRQSVHRQRHRSRAEVERALRDAGLRSVAVLGQLTGAVLEDHLDENVHTKALFIARPR